MPSDQLPIGGGPGGLGDGEHIQSFEQIALALAVRAMNKDQAGSEVQVQGLVVTEVREAQVADVDSESSRVSLWTQAWEAKYQGRPDTDGPTVCVRDPSSKTPQDDIHRIRACHSEPPPRG